MRKLVAFIAVSVGALLAGKVQAAQPAVREASIISQGSATCLSISTSAWTAVPATAMASRGAIFVTVTSTANASMNGHFGTSTTPTIALSVAPLLFKPGITQVQPLSELTILYLVSKHTAAETVCVQEVLQ